MTDISRARRFTDQVKAKTGNFEETAFGLLLTIIALSPVPFASNRPWSWSLFTIIAGIALGLWWIHVRRNGGRPIRLAWHLFPSMIAFAVVLLWATIQTLPWTPHSWHDPLWSQTATVLGMADSGSVSFDTQSTIDAIMRLIGYGAIFIVTWGFALDRERGARTIKVMLWTITTCAAYGLIIQFSGSNTVLWFQKWAYINNVTGPFVNRNSFSTYVGFGAVICAVLIFNHLKPAFEPELSRRETLLRLIKATIGTSWHYLAAGAVLLTALLLTGSRGGTASTFLGLMTIGALLMVREGSRRSLPLMSILVGGLAIIAFLSLSGEQVIDRTLATSITTEERQTVFALALTAINDHFWSGIGLGTFDPVFAIYRDTTLATSWDKAHNVYLETMLELGAPAALLLFASVAWIVVLCARGYFLRHRDRNYPLIAIGCAVIAVVHSAVDFSLQIPAVAMAFAVILGVGFAQSFSTERARS